MTAKLLTEFTQLRRHVQLLWIMAAVQAVLVGVEAAQQLAG